MFKSLLLFIILKSCFLLTAYAQNLPSPKDDGWNSEFLTNEIQKQFYKIITEARDEKALDKFISKNAHISGFDSTKLASLRNDAQVLIQKLDCEGSSKKKVTLNESFAELIGITDKPIKYTYKVKISRINVKDKHVEARVILYASNQGSEGVLQVNGIMDTEWILSDGKPLLNSIDVVSYENALLKSSKPWFKDATAAIFNKDEAFQEQISVGMNEWLKRVERFAGSNIYSRHGMAMGDANGDGLDDIYVCQPGGIPNRLFLKQEDGTLSDASSISGLDWLNDTRSALFIDLDNDGDQDIVLGTFVGTYLCRNNGSGVYEVAIKLEGVGRDVSSIVAADYDRDGYVDIYVCVYESAARLAGTDLSGHSVYDSRAKGGKNLLFRNLINENSKEWSFKDVTSSSGLDKGNERFTLAAAWEDFDNDGDQDLYIANDFGLNCLYENRDGSFEEVSKMLGVQDYSPGMSATWGDINRDGAFDLYVGNMFSSAGNRITRQDKFSADFEGVTSDKLTRFNRGNSLYMNSGKSFDEEPDSLGAQNALWAWSSLLGDIDNDGWEDILCANGYITGPGAGDL